MCRKFISTICTFLLVVSTLAQAAPHNEQSSLAAGKPAGMKAAQSKSWGLIAVGVAMVAGGIALAASASPNNATVSKTSSSTGVP